MEKARSFIRILLALSLGASVAHAASSDLQKEIDAEASMGMRATAPKPVVRSLIHIEPIAGITFAKYKGETAQGYSFTTGTGYEGGVGVLVGRGNFQFETGIMYAERTSREEYRMGISTWDLSYQNKYIELPLLARYNVINNNDLRLYVKGGAVASLLQDSTGTMSNVQNANMYNTGIYSPYGMYGATYNTDLINNNDTKSAFSTVDFRWAAGIGGQVRITKSIAMLLEGDYQTSVNAISNSQPNGYIGSTAMKLQMETYGIKAGVLISL
ncbi:MAG: outer membrane beta-barrel protein [Bdellovibrionales bacterium]|nr:outer membrane beta-barrel protein [Bdellovibrionales bacterium]